MYQWMKVFTLLSFCITNLHAQTVVKSGYVSLKVWGDSACKNWLQTMIYQLGPDSCVVTSGSRSGGAGTAISYEASFTNFGSGGASTVQGTVTMVQVNYATPGCKSVPGSRTNLATFNYAVRSSLSDAFGIIPDNNPTLCKPLVTGKSYYFGISTYTDAVPSAPTAFPQPVYVV